MAASLSTQSHLRLLDRVEELGARYDAAPASERMEAMIRKEFPGEIAVISSFGAELAVLLHLVSVVDRRVPVIFLETGRHFSETLRFRQELGARLGLENVIDVRPEAAQLAALDPERTLAAHDPDMCCHIRKTLPMLKALRPFRCMVTGRKRFQTETRAGLAVFEAQNRWIKFNPLAAWSSAEVDTYIESHGLPRHSLAELGYSSIGCEPCTQPVASGYRDGRWQGQAKTECGIHLTENGRLVRTLDASPPDLSIEYPRSLGAVGG